ncbi:MAG: hypothetical protein ACJ790_03930 [Myxococcaceae bacterium]
MALFTATGCIIPQDDHVLEPLTPVLNRPPRIVPSQIKPVDVPVRINNGLNCNVTFSVNVEDPDVADPINYDYFIDYDPSPGAVNPIYNQLGTSLPNSGRAQRSAAAAVTFLASPDLKLFTVGTHFVEIVVADGPINTQTLEAVTFNPGPPLPDGGTSNGPPVVPLPDGGASQRYADYYIWTVITTPGDCQ